jgi:hypothetical protein
LAVYPGSTVFYL